jgi:VanZ family protein
MSSRTFRHLFWLMWIAALAVTFLAGLIPQFAPPGEYEADKLIHAGVFFALALPAALLAGEHRSRAILAVAALGLAIEIGQSYVPGRTGSVFDFGADMVGVAMAAWVGLLLQRWLESMIRG